MVQQPTDKAATKMFRRIGTGRQAELADIREKEKKDDGEETKEQIMADNVEEHPPSDKIQAKVSYQLSFIILLLSLISSGNKKATFGW